MPTNICHLRNPILLGLLVAGSTLTSASQTSHPLVYRPTVVMQLGVSNLDKAVSFYTDVLEFRLTEKRHDLRFAHIQTNVTGLEIGLSEGSTQSGTGAAVMNLGVADVAAARTLLESRGVKFSGPTQVIPGKVALAGFADPDGNRLRLAGPPPRAQ